MAVLLDNIDKKILSMLQEDGRITYTEMANRLCMTRNAIKYRIDRMESEGIIVGYTAVLNPLKIEPSAFAILWIKAKPSNITKCINELEECKEVVDIYRLSGDTPLCVKAFFRSSQHLNHFVLSRLETLPIESYAIYSIISTNNRSKYNL